MVARLTIYKNGTNSDVRCEVEKWEFHDKAMGDQYVMFSIDSPEPIPFAIGDWCEFRGQRYTLNVEPTCTQKAYAYSYGAAFTYESVKFSAPQDDLTRCMILDVIPTSGEHQAAYGTNYTGSANFTLNCFETQFAYQGEVIYYAPVHALLDRIKANLDRLYPGDPQDPDTCWQIYIDDSKCHSDDKIITFSNWTAAQALAEVHNSFKLDYVVRGKKIIVGDVSEKYPELKDAVGYVTDLTEQDQPMFFGYGMGYLSEDNQGKSLFQIKKLTKNDQQIVTRLRAMGSTKNMPYRYYHKTYGTQETAGGSGLPQTMFVQNLQLPDTFVPYGDPSQEPQDQPGTKMYGNANRRNVYEGALRDVLGESNDAYIDKNDNAASCPEGIREGVARWDGSDGELPEIYPTIENATYGELRAAGVPDMDGNIANMDFLDGTNAFPYYGKKERIDEILEPGDHCNEGDGIMSDSEVYDTQGTKAPIIIDAVSRECDDITETFQFFNIATVQEPGKYILTFPIQTPQLFIKLTKESQITDYEIGVSVTTAVYLYQVPVDGSEMEILGSYSKNGRMVRTGGSYGFTPEDDASFAMTVPEFHEIEDGWSKSELVVTKRSTITAIASFFVGVDEPETGHTPKEYFRLTMGVRTSAQTPGVTSYAIWGPSGAALYYSDTPFHLRLKDIGVDFISANSLNGDDIVIAMKSGQCAGREFVVKRGCITQYQQDSTGKKGWDFELDRVNDETIHAYFPSATNQIKAGDQFVILNIELPDAYIKAAEVRLLEAASNYLADNCNTQYTYQPSVDDIYLQRNLDFHALDPENSVFWRLYAGMKFPFYGIPQSADDPRPVADITIESVSIKMGEKATPQVDITLNDKLQQTTMQRLQTSVDRLYGSVFSHGGVAYSSSSAVSDAIVRDFGKNYFLSKLNDDTAEGKITFNGDVDVQTLMKVANAYVTGAIGSNSFDDSFGGEGWKIDSSDNSMVLDEITVRKTMRIFEMLIQKVRSTGGEIIVSPASGRVKSVEEKNNAYVVELDSDGDNNFGNMFHLHDFVRCQKWDVNNNSSHYYWAMVTASNDNTIELNKSHFEAGVMPQVGDELVLFGNLLDTSRQGAITITASGDGKPRITVYNEISSRDLTGCTKTAIGDLSGISDSEFGGNLEGYGLYSDNVYLKGAFRMSSGTEIDDAKIVLQADKTTIKNLNGEEVAVFDSNGKLIIHDVESNSVKVISELNRDPDGAGGFIIRSALVASLGMGDGLLCYYYDNGMPMKEDSLIYGTSMDEQSGKLYNTIVGFRTTMYGRDGTIQSIQEWIDGVENDHPSTQTHTFRWTYTFYYVIESSDPSATLERYYQTLQNSDGIIANNQEDIEQGKIVLAVGGKKLYMSECLATTTIRWPDGTVEEIVNEGYNGTLVKKDLSQSSEPYDGYEAFSGIVFTSNTATSNSENRWSREYKIYIGGKKQGSGTIQWQE